MAIESFGYDGGIGETEWAGLSADLGAEYGVLGPDDWAVTPVSGADRAVSIAAGIGYGRGVRDVSSSPVTIQGEIVPSGSRWDLVVARRDWQLSRDPEDPTSKGGETTFVMVKGSSTRQIPAGRLVVPGVNDDQPIALVQFTGPTQGNPNGSQMPTGFVDLRCWAGNGGMVAASPESLAYLERLGSSVRVGDATWVRIIGPQGSPVWSSALRSLAETVHRPGAAVGVFTSSALLATADTIGTADYDRIVEARGIVNVQGVAAGGAWQAVLTSAGSQVNRNILDRARLPFSADADAGGSAVVEDRFVVPAGETCQPRLWVERLSVGELTVASSTRLRAVVRRAE